MELRRIQLYSNEDVHFPTQRSSSLSVSDFVASFPDLSCFYVSLVHTKHEREEKFEKQERPGTISHVR